ncbi:MAG: hypothetical protein M1450_03445 [Patescibacteria group bacterium]|nr:hypothetical protein [Patescibacteria group bacterium]
MRAAIEAGIIRRAVRAKDAIREFVADHSPKRHLQETQRLATGTITPEDRRHYREIAIQMYKELEDSPLGFLLEIGTPGLIKATITSIETADDYSIDRHIMHDATLKLANLNKPNPRVIFQS